MGGAQLTGELSSNWTSWHSRLEESSFFFPSQDVQRRSGVFNNSFLQHCFEQQHWNILCTEKSSEVEISSSVNPIIWYVYLSTTWPTLLDGLTVSEGQRELLLLPCNYFLLASDLFGRRQKSYKTQCGKILYFFHIARENRSEVSSNAIFLRLDNFKCKF